MTPEQKKWWEKGWDDRIEHERLNPPWHNWPIVRHIRAWYLRRTSIRRLGT